ncbi:hypothetical protein Ade02nite_11150 [Paractinoplanes deccanensis]|uniref:Histidine kinase/HSP90-like ATPase domain-containing protein n=1 Tax=Paractinoplanes deccanensis TaxID=113561 RepID=A0ABQ3XXJ5_9ACTN|nr:ATP-binding protein [Actinoplanes deccanensis]GID72474.1 hypothetical protein Ade02nite_11150 [Actinoplanes deccanensis]
MNTRRWPDMRVRHPLPRHHSHTGGSVEVSADVDCALTLVTVRGSWSNALRRDVFVCLKKALGEHPTGLVVDLSALDDPHASGLTTWLTMSQVAGAMQPPVRIVACLPSATVLADRLHRLGGANFLPTFETVAEARAACLAGVPATDRVRLQLPPDPDTPALARNLVTEACGAWRLPDVLYPGRLVMSELAANAVEHARTQITVVVSRRGNGLHLVVRDRDPRLPRIIEPPTPPVDRWEVRGMGLRAVQAASAGWGALPCAEGKMVWATIRPR